MDFNTLIDPMTPEEFTNEYKGKKLWQKKVTDIENLCIQT